LAQFVSGWGVFAHLSASLLIGGCGNRRGRVAGITVLPALHQGHVSLSPGRIWTVSFGSVGLALLIFGFALAIADVILANCRVAEIMFRSDDERKGSGLPSSKGIGRDGFSCDAIFRVVPSRNSLAIKEWSSCLSIW
jgi:hypothetical protein